MTRTSNMSAGGARSASVLPRAPYPPAGTCRRPVVRRRSAPTCQLSSAPDAFPARELPRSGSNRCILRRPALGGGLRQHLSQSQSNLNHRLVTPAHRPRLRPVSSPKHTVPALGPQRRPRCLRQVPWVDDLPTQRFAASAGAAPSVGAESLTESPGRRTCSIGLGLGLG